jgi:hypothetical protein
VEATREPERRAKLYARTFRALWLRRGTPRGMPSPSHRSIARQNRRLAGERALAITPSLLAERLSLQTGRAPRRGSSKPRAALLARHFVACAGGATQNQARPLHADSRAGRAFNFWKRTRVAGRSIYAKGPTGFRSATKVPTHEPYFCSQARILSLILLGFFAAEGSTPSPLRHNGSSGSTGLPMGWEFSR